MGLFLLKYLDDWFIQCDEDIQFPCICYRIPNELPVWFSQMLFKTDVFQRPVTVMYPNIV